MVRGTGRCSHAADFAVERLWERLAYCIETQYRQKQQRG